MIEEPCNLTEKEKKALDFAIMAHEGQKRKKSKKDYVTHPIAVCQILMKVTKDEDILCAALLHDVIEDTEFTYKDIKKIFGRRIANIVMEVTKDENGDFHITSREGLMVKLADMLHNIHDNDDIRYINKKIDFTKNALKGDLVKYEKTKKQYY